MSKNEMNIFKLIIRERFITGFMNGLYAAAALIFVFAVIRLLFFILKIDAPLTGVFCLFSAAAGFLVFFFAGRGRKKKTAEALDRIEDGKSRLECAVELRKTSHPLRSVQLDEAQRYFGKRGVGLRLGRLLMPCIIFAVLTGLYFFIPFYSSPLGNTKKKNAEGPETGAAVQKKEFAEISFTAPEAEMRAKPMDEIDFEGDAFSTNGFRNISLKISVNAKLKKTINVNAEKMRKPGKISFAGEFSLDELEVNPFDLVSYTLLARTLPGKEKALEVESTPQFIEVRPFREDAFTMDGMSLSGNMEAQMNLLNELIKFLQGQINLNKSTYMAKAAMGRIDKKVMKEELSGVSGAQGGLYKEVLEFLEKTNPEIIPANVFYSIRKASENMKEAHSHLENISGSFKNKENAK